MSRLTQMPISCVRPMQRRVEPISLGVSLDVLELVEVLEP